MKKEKAKEEKIKYANLQNKILIHKKYNTRMQIIDIGIEETCSKKNNFYVFCKLNGELGTVTETLEYVLENYRANSD